MAGEFLVKNFGVKTKDEENKKGSFLLDNFKIDPTPVKPADVFLPTADFKTGGMAKENAAPLSMPASKAGAHRTRNTGFTSQPKINNSTISSPGVRPTSLLKEYNKDRADSIKAGGKALGYGLANTKWLANSAKAIDDWAAEHLFYGNHNELLKAWYESNLEAAKVLEDDLQKDIDEGKINPITSQLMQGTGSAVQTAIIAGMSGGMGSAAGAGTAATGAAAPSTAKIAAQSAVQLAKNPTFVFSTVRSFGNAYEEAVNGGADTDTAIRAALLQAVPEAIIEVSGGTEKLISQLADKTKGMSGSVLRSALEEGLEEILQYPFSGLAKKATYAPETPFYSTTEQAVINPKDQVSSAVMGGIIGGLMGGGAKAADAIANNAWMKNDPILQSLDWGKPVDKSVDAGYNQVGGELNGREVATGQNIDAGGTGRGPNPADGTMAGRQGGSGVSSAQEGGALGDGTLRSAAPSTKEIPEPAGTFIARATQEGRIVEADDFGNIISYRPTKNIGENAAAAQEILSRRGLDSFAYEGSLSRNKNGTTTEHLTDAQTLLDGRIGIKGDCALPGIEIAGHEGFHSITVTNPEVAEPFLNLIANPVNPEKAARFKDTQDYMGALIYGKRYNPSNKEQQRRIIKELAAQVGGKADNNLEEAREIFGDILDDFDAAYAMWKKTNADFDALKSGGGPKANGPMPPLQKPPVPTLPESDPIVQLNNGLKETAGLEEERVAQVLTAPGSQKAPVKEAAKGAYDVFMRKFVDVGHTIARVGKIARDPQLYYRFNNAKQSRMQANYAIGGQGVLGNVGAQTDVNGRPVGESLYSILKPVKAKGESYFKTFSEYLFHKHNVDRMSLQERYGIENKPVFGYSVTSQDSAVKAGELEALHPEFKALAEKIYKYNQNLMQYRVDTGLVSKKQADLMNEMYPHYVPTFREKPSSSGAYGTNRAVRINTGIKKATGSNLNLRPLDDSMGRQTLQTYAAGRRNLFGLSLYSSALKHKGKLGSFIHAIEPGKNAFDVDMDTDFPDLNNQFTVYENGQPIKMELNTGMFEGVKSLAADTSEKSWLKKMPTAVNDTFKKLVTGYNPMFLARNFARDLQDAGMYSKDLSAFMKNYPKAWKEMAQNGPLWQQYQALGGFGSSYMDYDTGLKQNRSLLQRSTVDTVENLNMMVEQAPRFTEFLSTIEKGGASYDNLMRAMYNAADVTVNFGRSGSWGKVLNSTFVPFFNPGVQGTSKFIRRFTETKGAKEWTSLVIKAAALGIAPKLLNALMYEDDKDYQIINDREKDTNYLFKIDDGLFVKIPIGRVNSLFGMTADKVRQAAKGQEVDWAGFVSTAASQMLPANPFTSNIASQFLNADLFNPDSAGQTWYGSPIEGQRMQNIADPSQRYDESTDVISKWIGENTGLSPKKLNYIMDSYSGVIGDFALPLLTPRAEQNPFVKAFTIDSTLNNKLSDQFYDQVNRVTAARQAEPGEDQNDVTGRYLSSQQREISELYETIREVENSELTDKQKREEVRELRDQLNQLQAAALETIPEFEEAAGRMWSSSEDVEKAYFDANLQTFGAQHALKVYDEDVYKKAQELYKQGISYDKFAEVYQAYKPLKSTGSKTKTEQFREYLLNNRQLTAKEKADFDRTLIGNKVTPDYTNADTFNFSFLSDEAKESYKALSKMNLSAERFLNYYNQTKTIEGSKDKNGKTISGSQKENRRARLREMGLTDAQARKFLEEVYDYSKNNWK